MISNLGKNGHPYLVEFQENNPSQKQAQKKEQLSWLVEFQIWNPSPKKNKQNKRKPLGNWAMPCSLEKISSASGSSQWLRSAARNLGARVARVAGLVSLVKATRSPAASSGDLGLEMFLFCFFPAKRRPFLAMTGRDVGDLR